MFYLLYVIFKFEACAIDDQDSKSVIFTGGNTYKKGVSRYNVNVSFSNIINHE